MKMLQKMIIVLSPVLFTLYTCLIYVLSEGYTVLYAASFIMKYAFERRVAF